MSVLVAPPAVAAAAAEKRAAGTTTPSTPTTPTDDLASARSADAVATVDARPQPNAKAAASADPAGAVDGRLRQRRPPPASAAPPTASPPSSSTAAATSPAPAAASPGGEASSAAAAGAATASAAAAAAAAAAPSTNAKAAAAANVSAVLGGVLWTVAWMLCSSALIVLNKSLYRRGFAYPSTVTGLGQLFSALSGLLLAATGAQRLRPLPGPAVALRLLLPITAASSATMYFGNVAYLYLSVAFIQILKAFTPALTLVLCAAAGLEAPTLPLLAAIGMMAAGTAGAVLVERGAPSFNVIGFAAFMASSLTEAARVVGAELLQGGSKFNTAESLVYVSGPTALVLLTAGAVYEGPDMLAAARGGGGLALVAADPLTFLAAASVSALVNLSCFLAISATSSLTFKVAGCVKNVAVVGYGVVAHGETVTWLQMLGYGVSVAGFTLYSHLKLAAGAKAGAKTKAS